MNALINHHTKRIFICYRREDSADVAARIFDVLTARFGRGGVFIDVNDIPDGIDWREVIDQKLEESSEVLVIIGSRWLAAMSERVDDPNDRVRYEIEVSLRRGIPVVPVLVHNATLPDKAELRQSIQGLVWKQKREVRSGRHFDRDAQAMCEGIEKTRKWLEGKKEDRPKPLVLKQWHYLIIAAAFVVLVGFAWPKVFQRERGTARV